METTVTTDQCGICGRTCRLTARQRECYMKIPAKVDAVWHPSFDDPEARRRYAAPSQTLAWVDWRLFHEVPEDSCDMPVRKPLGREAEAELFLRYNFARHELARLQRRQQRTPTVERAIEMAAWHEQVQQRREELAAANLSLVIAMAKRTRIPGVEFAELVSEGNVVLLRAIEKFDVARGFKFSTYACRSILQGYNRLAGTTGRHAARFGFAYDPDLERADYDVHRDTIGRDELVDDVRDVLSRNRADLTETERYILQQRFGLESPARPKTLLEVARLIGLSIERVRQLQNQALSKLRAALSDQYLPV